VKTQKNQLSLEFGTRFQREAPLLSLKIPDKAVYQKPNELTVLYIVIAIIFHIHIEKK